MRLMDNVVQEMNALQNLTRPLTFRKKRVKSDQKAVVVVYLCVHPSPSPVAGHSHVSAALLLHTKAEHCFSVTNNV